ncbi:unnamed protein product [Merluccius merluccius]
MSHHSTSHYIGSSVAAGITFESLMLAFRAFSPSAPPLTHIASLIHPHPASEVHKQAASDTAGTVWKEFAVQTVQLCAVSRSSDVFEKVLAPLQKAFLYEESKEAFKYTSAFLFNNSILQEKYDAFRANRREAGFSQEELKEGYGFLLFDDISKAIEVGETGVLTGNSACKTLGDPSKGVYVSKYSDCLAPDHWYCGKAGFIVIIRLTKGRINKVEENYTQNFIAPSVGFDCHESKELPMVSGNTSSFLAYERTQYYLYELLPGECSKTTLSPSHVCPFAIVPFSYDDANTKATTSSCQELRYLLNGMMWSGQLHISSQIYNVRLKSRLGALIPVKLPPVVKVDQAVSMVTLRQFAPKAVFETHFAGEVSLDGICCSVYEFVPIEAEDPSLSLLIRELKDKDLGLTVLLDGSGFLILLPSSNFAACTGNESSVTEALQAMFLFPGSRAKQKDTKEELEESQITPDILPILPALDYAEIEVQKSAIGPSEDMRGQFVQQIKNYAALINSGLAATPSKDVNPLSQDYDDKSLTSLCYSPKWTNQVWQWMRSYLSYPVSFQLPVYSVTELLAGNKRQKEVLDQDKDYVCPSPLEQAPGTVCSIGPEELLSESTASDVSSSLQNDGANKDSETNSILNCPLSRNPTDELVVSISSEEGTTTVMDICLSGSNAVVATKHYEQQLSNTQLVATNTVMKPSENPTARKTLPRGRPKGKRKGFKRSHPPADEPLTTTSEKQDEGRPPSQCTSINDPPKTEWAMSECEGGKLTYKYKKVTRSRLQENAIKKNKPRRMENVTSTCFLTRKTDRCDLKPIITGCGRTLVPHGSLNVLQKIDYEQRIKTIIETSEEACQLEKTDQDPAAGRLAVNTTNNVNAGDKCHITEVVGSTHSETASSPQRTRTQEFGDHCMVNIAEDTSDRLPSSTSDISSHLNDGKRLLCKLKTLFSKRKRKNTQDEDSVLPVDSQSTEPSLKKCNSDMDREMLKTELNCQDSRERNKDVLRTFAQALGLMPKEVPDKIQETQNTGTLEKRLPISLEGQFIPPVVKSAQLRVPSPIQEKLQGKRRLQKRKTWGKSLRTPSSSTTKNPKNQVCAKSNSSEKNLKELFCSTGQSTNALNLLADLALGDGNNQLDPLPKDGAKLDNQSVLPSMLNQPADSRVLPSISPSPEGLVGGKDVIDLIAKEHTYSSSTTSQVPTTSSPEGMSQHDQNLFGPGLPALCNVPPEGTIELKASIEDMNKDAIPSRKFRRSRIFVEKEGSLKVTRKWKGNYDFELDSKFTNHPVEKTVCRGLHGSWNFAVKDNGEEARLIIHMWIGLFYSCPTPRFIHSIPLDLEDSLEMSDGMVLPSVRKTATVSIGDSEAQDLEPIQEDGIVLNQVSDVLDLSIKKQDVNDGKENSNIALDKLFPEEHDAVDEAKIEIFGAQEKSNDSTPLQDCVVGESQAEVLPDISVVSCGHQEQDEELIENKVATACILAQKAASHHQSQSPQDGVSRLLQDSSEMPVVGKDDSKPVEAGPQDLPLQDNPVEVVHGHKEVAMNIDRDPTSPENCKKVQIAESILPAFEDGDSKHKSTSEDKNLNIALDKTIPEEHDNNYSMDEANIEIVSEQNKSDNVSTSLQDGIVGESQAEVPPDVSVVSCDHQEQDEELIENEVETAYISAPTAACRQQAQSPQDGVSKLLQDQSEISLVGKDDSKQEVEAGPQVLPLQDSPVEVVLEPKDMAMNIDVCCTSPENCEKIQIVENVLSVFEDSDSKHKLCPEDSEMDQRCPTPTKEDGAVFYCQATLVGQPYEGNGKKDAYSDKMLQTQHAKANTSMGGGGDDDDGDNISKESLNIALDKTIPDEHDNNYSMNEANIEIVSEQNKSDNDSTLLQDGIVSESQAEVPPDVSVVGCDHQEQYDELIENEVETAYILAPKAASHHQAQSPQDGVSKLISDPSEKPLVGKDESKQEVEAGPQVLPFQENILEMANEPKEMAMNINVYNLSLENSEKVQVAENVLSVFEDSNYEHKLGSEAGELDERCPTPTVDENPYEYIPSLEQSISNEVGKSSPEKEHRTNSTLTHQWGTEVHAELELKTVGDQDPGRDLRQENQTPRSRLLETNDLPASLSQSPTLCRKTMDMDNYKTSHVNVGRSPAKQSPVKRKMFSEEGCSLPLEERGKGKKPSSPVSSIVSMQSNEDEEILKMGPSTSSFKYTNYRFTKTVSKSLEQLTETCIDSDLTQFSMEQDFLIFSEEMKQLLNGSKRGPGKNPNHRSLHSYPSSDGPQSIIDLSINVDVPESDMEETTGEKISYHHEFSSRRNSAEANIALSDIEAECTRSYQTMMDNICAGKSHLTETDGGSRDHASTSRQMTSEMFGSLNHGLNLVVRQSSKTKFRFYILMTSDDAFFEETKALLKADGHTEVQPSHFFLNEQSSSSSSLLLIILRNEDIAEHIIKVPHLLDLKKSANVLFAGIDQPDDIGNLTHQDLFKKGGFIMLEGTALEALSFCKMKELLDFLQELSKNGKWKWILHYRDSRRLKENARFSAEDTEKKHLMKCCQETGIVEVLPYHECDHMSRDHPSYLNCLSQLQVHNVTARFPVFVTDKTDATADNTFGRHGILTMNINSLLTVIESEKCSLGAVI